jgi:RNA polymerase sigma factor (sigma-70 family)
LTLLLFGGRDDLRAQAVSATPEPAVFAVSSSAAVRAKLAQLLEAAGFRVRSLGSTRDFFRAVASDEPGCVFLEWPVSNAGGWEFCRALRRRGYSVPLVAILDGPDVAAAVAAMKAGAFDAIELARTEEFAVETARAAIEVDEQTRESLLKSQLAQKRLTRLSRQQKDFLRLFMEGKEIAEIAAQLGLSEERVESRRTRLMKDLKVSNLIELVELLRLAAGGRNDS